MLPVTAVSVPFVSKLLDNLSSLQKRVLAVLVMAPLFLAALYVGGITFKILILAVSVIGLLEWSRLAKTPVEKFAGIFYLFIPALCLIWTRQQGLSYILIIVLAVWMTDIGAYFTGRKFGGPKVAPKISPNKTWSGLIGGMLSSALSCGLVAYYFDMEYAAFYPLIGAVLAVIAQAGDFFESWMKRRAGVKDSGTLIPGHGGILDRIDGLLTAVPCFTFFIWLTL